MGKSKKTRWRTFEISGSQDETQTNGGDVKVNGDSDSQAPVTSQKYSQILGDHHTNSSTHQFNNRSSSHHIYKSRGYNNKENFYNQRTGARPGTQRSWQRGGNYRTSFVNGKDKSTEENEKAGLDNAKVDSTAEPIKFNEDEYTRITTPRQDVLFKKGYLSRMNNKTATNLSATVNSVESTAASSTITTSDPDSSVSTLSPATTPSMDFAQTDLDYAPMYYPGYYDENGMLVIPMYNGYNYYPPPSGSTATSPVFLMPYPSYHQYDPFFMTPTGMQPVDGDATSEDKTESDGAKENNQQAENGARTSSSSDDGASNQSEEIKDDEVKKEKATELNGNGDENVSIEANNPDQKQNFPIYSNELNGYMYPAYQNGYYNNFYYYNGAQSSRPPKMRRRKRFLNSRNSHQQQQPRSAETTTDYSDDDNMTYTRRFNPRYQNGWSYHNGYNHFNGNFHKVPVDQNGNPTPHEFHLNVDVQEFYPRIQSSPNEPETIVNRDETSADLERVDKAPSPKQKVEAPKATKTSQPSSKPTIGRTVSKKEIIEGIKSMEQQNIDLMATKHQASKTNANRDDEWNVIKKGKKVKVVKDIKMELTASDVKDVVKEVVKEEKEKPEEIKIVEKTETISLPEVVKKSPPAQNKPKKTKNKGKKKKAHLMVKQDGFEIIEPEFNSTPTVEDEADEVSQDVSEEETIVESDISIKSSENGTEHEIVLNGFEDVVEKTVASVAVAVKEEDEAQVKKILEVNDLTKVIKVVEEDDDAVIDISDEDICCKVSSIPLALTPVQEVVSKVEVAFETAKIPAKIQEITKPELKLEIPVKKEVEPKPELFQDTDFFNDRTNIAALERDLMENLRLLDDEIDLKSPIINPLYDFPITSAVQKWLQAKQNESFDNLFHVQNFQKLSDLYDEDDDEDETESDISEKELKSETDSDYASDFHSKANGGSPTCSTHAKGSSEKSSKCNKLIAKESFCALM